MLCLQRQQAQRGVLSQQQLQRQHQHRQRGVLTAALQQQHPLRRLRLLLLQSLLAGSRATGHAQRQLGGSKPVWAAAAPAAAGMTAASQHQLLP